MAEDGEGNSTGQQTGGFSNQNQMNFNSAQYDPDDPMYLHVIENPNLILVSPPLSNINYTSWSRSMKIALEEKNKYGFIDGTIAKPAETILFGPGYSSRSALQLQKEYSILNLQQKSGKFLERDTPKSSQGNLFINEYFTKTNALWVQLNAMRPIPTCECVPKCSCALVSKIKKEKEEDQIIRFLEGLNEEYEDIKSGILVMEPIPVMEKVLNMTLKMERKLKNSMNIKCNDLAQASAVQNVQAQHSDEQIMIAASNSYNRKKFNTRSQKNVPKCTFCGIQANDIGLSPDQFQRLVSLLQNQKQGNKSSTNAAVTVNNAGLIPDFRNSMENSHNEGRSISDSYVNTVLNSSNVWILDSGATDHIVCSLEYFETFHAAYGVLVKLPNGDTVKVTHIGQVRLHMNILLKNVLFIPSFQFNIISASKLTKESKYEIVMRTDSCTLQGHLGTVDGFASEKCGL
ncbi:PREDICTED: uncharacterized protein LOC109185067 [Ipomoea nil]|uniref:uncharacterized protein LOC109185067 n=1 Tax=Ipomoea nil TaxID=35883 RepID=UPI000901F9C3|nr:PREDICTED: uncharacterized protein LOC109185067 [Ipomoea nil]